MKKRLSNIVIRQFGTISLGLLLASTTGCTQNGAATVTEKTEFASTVSEFGESLEALRSPSQPFLSGNIVKLSRSGDAETATILGDSLILGEPQAEFPRTANVDPQKHKNGMVEILQRDSSMQFQRIQNLLPSSLPTDVTKQQNSSDKTSYIGKAGGLKYPFGGGPSYSYSQVPFMNFGSNVSAAKDIIVVSEIGREDILGMASGRVYVYKKVGSQSVDFLGPLPLPPELSNYSGFKNLSRFGSDVATNGEIIAVLGPDEPIDLGLRNFCPSLVSNTNPDHCIPAVTLSAGLKVYLYERRNDQFFYKKSISIQPGTSTFGGWSVVPFDPNTYSESLVVMGSRYLIVNKNRTTFNQASDGSVLFLFDLLDDAKLVDTYKWNVASEGNAMNSPVFFNDMVYQDDVLVLSCISCYRGGPRQPQSSLSLLSRGVTADQLGQVRLFSTQSGKLDHLQDLTPAPRGLDANEPWQWKSVCLPPCRDRRVIPENGKLVFPLVRSQEDMNKLGSLNPFYKTAKKEDLFSWDEKQGGGFACSAKIKGDIIVVGACAENNSKYFNAGSIYIFKFNGTRYEQTERIVNPFPIISESDGIRSIHSFGDVKGVSQNELFIRAFSPVSRDIFVLGLSK